MEDKVEYCANCKRLIAATNYVIHSAHCERNIQLCERCEEPVPRSEKERHLEENHSIHACSDCGAPMEKWLIEKHKSSCPKKLTPCEFCKLEVPLDELLEHATACGSRTEKCIICKKHVMIKDLEEHPNFCQRGEEETCNYCGLKVAMKFFVDHAAVCEGRTLFEKDIENGEYNCEMCGSKVPLNNVEVHVSMCRGHDPWKKDREDAELVCYYCGLLIPASSFGKHTSLCRNTKDSGKDSEDKELTCEICEFKIPFSIYDEHIFVCGTIKEPCLICNENVMAQDKKRHLEICRKEQFFKQKIPCKYCEESISEDEIMDHVLNCGSRTEKCEKCKKYVVLKEKEMHSSVCRMVSKTHGNCRYCHEIVPWIQMNIHEAVCALENRSDDYTHQNMLNELSIEKSYPYEKGMRNDERSNQVYEKRCSFCSRKFPLSCFPKHLECCEERPYNCSECLKAMPYKEKEKHNRFLCYGNKGKKEHVKALALFEENKSIDEDIGIQKLKQCHFCDERLPDLIFENHVGSCSKRREKCKLCHASVLVREMKNHHKFSCSFSEQCDNRYLDCDAYLYAENMPASSKSSEQLKYLEENVKICLSCKCKIPVARFTHHMQYCLKDTKPCKFCGFNIQKRDERAHLQNCGKLLDACRNYTSSSVKNDYMEYKSKNDGESFFFGNIGRWFQNKGKKEDSMEQIQNKYASQGGKNRRKTQDPIIPNQPPQNEIPLLPCEFCEELYPFEVLIEHQSGCRPDLVSYPKKDEQGKVDRYMLEHDKSRYSYSSIASRNSRKVDAEWTEVSSRKSKEASMKKIFPVEEVEPSSDRNNQLSKESGFPHINRDKYFYYPPSGYAETEGNCIDESKEKHFSKLNQSGEIAYIKEIDSERLSKSLLGVDSYQSYKLNSSTDMKEDYNSSSEQSFGRSTDNKHNQHRMKGNDSYHYQVFPPLPNDEKSILSKVVGAERVEKVGAINKTKNAALRLVYNDNSKDYPIDKQIVSDDNAIKRNLTMKTVWNTECDTSDNHKKLSESNHEMKVKCNLFSNIEKVSNIVEDRKHINDETITNEQQDNNVLSNDSEMNAYFKYLSFSNEGYFDVKENKVEEKEELASDSVANCDCGNQICYCAIAKESSLKENSSSSENSHMKNFHPDTHVQDICDNNDPKPMEIDSPFEEKNALNPL